MKDNELKELRDKIMNTEGIEQTQDAGTSPVNQGTQAVRHEEAHTPQRPDDTRGDIQRE